jgi:diaminopimelate epimerase
MVDGAMTRLTKLHATGNDFLVTTDPLTGSDAVALCARHTGIGADGLLILGPGRDGADATMTLYNADGGVAEMSGNGARCLAWVARREGMGTPERLVVDTGGGRRTLDLTCDDDGVLTYAVCDMGAVTIEGTDLLAEAGAVSFEGDAVSIGNPHWVIVVDDPAHVDLGTVGPALEHDVRFPDRVNVEFIAPAGLDAIRMRVWERGVGETQSCGTGACAAAKVAHRRGLVGADVIVHVPGGTLTVGLGDTVRLGGPVVHVFDVDIDPAARHA